MIETIVFLIVVLTAYGFLAYRWRNKQKREENRACKKDEVEHGLVMNSRRAIDR